MTENRQVFITGAADNTVQKKIMRLMLLVLIPFILIMSAAEVFAGNAAMNQVTPETKYIMIGDSYAIQPVQHPEKNWPDQLYKRLNMQDTEVCIIKRGGYGFIGKHNQKAFIDLIRPLESSQNIKAIIIAGGLTNDLKFSKQKIRKAFKKLNTLLKEKYPNAKVYYGAINWKKKKSVQRTITKRKALYYLFSQENGWVYLPRAQDALKGQKHCIKKDKHHPTMAGVNRIVAAMYEDLKGYFPVS